MIAAAVVNLAPTLKTSRENSSREIITPRRAFDEHQSEAIRVTGMYTYGRVELEPRGAPPPPGWTELMLAMHHQEPVGRCFQR